jgi:uncharacterized protein
MPANLTAPYKVAEAAYRAAVTREEKLAALEEMLRQIPKHKGTEKLQGDLRSRIAKLKKEPTKKGGTRGPSHRIPAEGAGQVVLVGPPNAGKSALVAVLTAADPVVADYPMSTRDATPGMMPFRDIAIQLVDLPPVCDEHVENWVYDIIRGADLAWLVVSIAEPLGGIEMVERLLAQRAIRLLPHDEAAGEPRADPGESAAEGRPAEGRPAEERPAGERPAGERPAGERQAGERPAEERPAEERPAGERRPGWTYLPTLMVVTGMDRPGAREDLGVLDELLPLPWPRAAVSTVTGAGMAALGDRTFEALKVMRVYSKEPGHDPDMERPFTLPIGATVGDLARAIHGDLAEGLKFARVWGHAAFDGQRVNRDHALADGDVVELRA